MTGRRSLALLVATLTAAALMPAALAGAAAPTAADRASAQERAEHARVVAFWTPERMRAAIPRDFARQPDGTFRLAPTAKGKPGGGGTTTAPSCETLSADVAPAVTTGASWPCVGGDVNKRTGKVFFSIGSSNYVCSGAVAEDGGADSNGRALVLTAGHCVYDQAAKAFVSNWLFVPDYDTAPTKDCTSNAYGCWTAAALVAHRNFVDAGSFNSQAILHDYAFAVVGLGSRGRELDAVVGGEYPLVATPASGAVTALGYPAARPYSGSDLVHCHGTPFPDTRNSGSTLGLACTMTGGASGGPWLSGLRANGSGGALVSLNSYKYTGQKDFMYGPYFTSETAAVHTLAKGIAASDQQGNFTNP